MSDNIVLLTLEVKERVKRRWRDATCARMRDDLGVHEQEIASTGARAFVSNCTRVVVRRSAGERHMNLTIELDASRTRSWLAGGSATPRRFTLRTTAHRRPPGRGALALRVLAERLEHGEAG